MQHCLSLESVTVGIGAFLTLLYLLYIVPNETYTCISISSRGVDKEKQVEELQSPGSANYIHQLFYVTDLPHLISDPICLLSPSKPIILNSYPILILL